MVVHNAGITRDKTLGRMTEEQWSKVIAINLTAPQRITEELLARDAVRRNGRIVGVSSISGIAGNAGQTNYSTSKAGVIGFVQAYAPALAKRGVTINAVAPGFIETQMTAAMPIAIREAGRRMNSVSQGGLPVDVAETVAWFAGPGVGGRHRQHRPRLRPEPDRSVSRRHGRQGAAAARPRCCPCSRGRAWPSSPARASCRGWGEAAARSPTRR